MRPTKIICHHTSGTDLNPLADSSNFTFQQCEDLHKQRFNFKSSLGFWTGYQYYIEKSGKIYQARKDDEEGAHTIGQNTSSIGICLAGNFDITMPTFEQVESLRTLLKDKMLKYGIFPSQIYPHRHFASKTCYGRNLSDDWARKLVTQVLPPKPEDGIIKMQKTLLEKLKQLYAILKTKLK